jgi:quercetin dioxygenase-like cupin family protein
VSSIHRTLAGDVLIHHLTEDERIIDQALLAQHGRSARTLVKEGLLRLTLIAIAAGGDLPAHSTTGPITMQVLEGEIVFGALGREYVLRTGDILVLAPGIEHSASSATGGVFLLTVVHANSAGSRITSDGAA